ncbi:oxidoreductase [Klebsiella pneumoniae subsp. ozaenae]|uniref:Oxidoreductase n=1 Tax=Klebsiella pneumoniae subsp. ozaenae TaxID=574 RepID=A0A378ATY7_KLEPO|nr:oxidoreductase [Klebsiella pneumoniae subsp. ozaenae]
MMTVLITGASSGIGTGLAKSFAADGHLVIACGRDASRLAALQQLSPNISVRLFDMTDRDACRQALTGCFADLIILCAGTCEYLDHGQVDAALVERVMATQLPRAGELPGGAADAAGGRRSVVLVSSMAHWLPFPRAEAYGASKAALSWFANSLRLDWESKGVAVTVVSPGFVDTPLTRKNDFAMPGRVSVDRAVAAIRHGLAKGKNHIAFPTASAWPCGCCQPAIGYPAPAVAQDGALMNIAIIAAASPG